MKKLTVCLALVSLLALGGQAMAEICTIDDVPAATLLLPYFEVDLTNLNGVNTLFSINNASNTAAVAHVTLWTDESIPTLDFDVYLTGFDVQTISLRDIFNGVLPRTADVGIDPDAAVLPVESRGWHARLARPLQRLIEIVAVVRRTGAWTRQVLEAVPDIDIYHAKALIALPVIRSASRARGVRFVYDLADLHTEAARLARMPAWFRRLVRGREAGWVREAAALTAVRASQHVLDAIEAAFQKMEISDPTSPESIDADVAFHSAILAGTGNDFIAAFTPVIAAALNVTFRIQRDVGYGREHFVPSHRLILDAIKRGDPDGTREVYMKLLTTAEQDATSGIRQRGT